MNELLIFILGFMAGSAFVAAIIMLILGKLARRIVRGIRQLRQALSLLKGGYS
jgi:hypothetical protein